MKRLLIYLMTAGMLTTACSTDNGWMDDDWNTPGYNEGTDASNSGTAYDSSISELTSFDIAIDETALTETETIPTEEDADNYEDYIENNTFSSEVSIAFDGTSATVSGEVKGVTVTTTGADVVVTSTAKKVKYIVSGTTTNGFLKIYSDNKFALQLNGVDITNPDGAPLNIQSKKRGFIILTDGTVNKLTDGTTYNDATESEDMKAALFSEGKLLFSGKGTLQVNANCKAGIRSDDYVFFRPGNNIYVKATAGNGIKANDAIYIKGGVINVEASATAAKALSCDGLVQIDGGRTTAITTGGGELDEDGTDVTACAGIKADSIIVINSGTVLCKSTGAGGKGISTDQTLTVNGGTIKVITTGKQYVLNKLDTSPKGIKSDGNMYIKGGDIRVRCSGGEGSEGIESKGTMEISGGSIEAYCYDDAINSALALTISGGNVFAVGTNNDGIDSNSTITISGGVVIACGTTTPEAGIDCDEHTFAITGGTVIGIGGTTSTPTSSACSQPVAIVGGNGIASGQFITAADASGNNLLAFKVPMSYSQQGCTLLLSSPKMTKGNAYTISAGATVTNGTDFCGYVTGATVSGGTTLATMTLSQMVNSYNFSGGQGGGQPGGGGQGGGRGFGW